MSVEISNYVQFRVTLTPPRGGLFSPLGVVSSLVPAPSNRLPVVKNKVSKREEKDLEKGQGDHIIAARESFPIYPNLRVETVRVAVAAENPIIPVAKARTVWFPRRTQHHAAADESALNCSLGLNKKEGEGL
ncbi:unnamed protein product [Pieris macdunnoughi]|uniref:Uncharacterized protein n=1 Tax=Pieris macdunnoughi TaxID=345717 RepID=A0A821P1W3_9NEOP|nr:unnamed protein product [Pieris macdunnoughi]